MRKLIHPVRFWRTPLKRGIILAGVIAIATVLLPTSFAYSQIAINLEAIKMIESSNRPYLFEPRTKCYGLYQISEICLRDFNQWHKTNHKSSDLFDPVFNKKVAVWYFKRIEVMLNFYKIPISRVTLIASYNWGIGNVLKWYRGGARLRNIPRETQRYIMKYRLLVKNLSLRSLARGGRSNLSDGIATGLRPSQ